MIVLSAYNLPKLKKCDTEGNSVRSNTHTHTHALTITHLFLSLSLSLFFLGWVYFI